MTLNELEVKFDDPAKDAAAAAAEKNFMKDETLAVLSVQIAPQVADKHSKEDELITEVQNALTTGQHLTSLMKVDALLIMTLS